MNGCGVADLEREQCGFIPVSCTSSSATRSAVYESSPLQRRLRDLHIAVPHATVQQRHYEDAGKAALAQYRRQFEDPWKLAAQ